MCIRDRIYVVDSENVTIGEQILVQQALQLRAQGLSAGEIAAELDQKKKEICLIALLNTLEYLKRGGRISSTVAFAGSLLSIKPVVSIENGEVNVIGKARGDVYKRQPKVCAKWKRMSECPDNQDVGLEAATIKRMRNSSLVECTGAENVTGLKHTTEI